MTEYDTLIPTARAFYSDLAANNTRDWWQENRGPYDNVLKPGAKALLADLTAPLAALADAPIKTKQFRPNRDVRFSNDKSPYNTHLHMMWQLDTEARQNPVFFFGIGLDYITTGAGMMGFDKPVLEDWRKFVDLDTDRMLGIVAGVEAKGYARRPPELKRVPPAFAKDHPGGDLLRHKGFTIGRELDAGETYLRGALLAAFTDMWPVNALLLQVAAA